MQGLSSEFVEQRLILNLHTNAAHSVSSVVFFLLASLLLVVLVVFFNFLTEDRIQFNFLRKINALRGVNIRVMIYEEVMITY